MILVRTMPTENQEYLGIVLHKFVEDLISRRCSPVRESRE